MSTSQFYTLSAGLWEAPGRQSEGSGTVVQPTTANVGAATSGLTTYNGNFLVTTDNTVIENLDIHGYIKIRAANVTVRNCRVRGYQINSGSSAGESTIGLISVYNAECVGAVVQNCTLIPDYPSWDWDGLLGHDVTVTDSLIAHVTDGMGIYNTAAPGAPVNVTIDHCYIGFMAWFSPTQSGNSDNATHNDCIQILGGTNITIKNSTLNGFRSMPDGMGVYDDPFGYVGQAALTVAPAGYNSGTSGTYNPTYPSPTSGSVIQFNNSQGTPQAVLDSNWADGGGASYNVSVPLAAGSKIINNRFGHNQRLQGAGGDDTYTINGGGSSGANLTVSGNVYDDNDDPVRWRQ